MTLRTKNYNLSALERCLHFVRSVCVSTEAGLRNLLTRESV